MMDRAASAGFEGIAQMLLEQKKLMDALEAENRELRRQVSDLRRGVGIALVIDGKTIQLASDSAGGIQAGAQSHASQATLQSLQNLQNSPNSSGYMSRQTGGQQAVGGVGEKQNGNSRNPLADSFVL